MPLRSLLLLVRIHLKERRGSICLPICIGSTPKILSPNSDRLLPYSAGAQEILWILEGSISIDFSQMWRKVVNPPCKFLDVITGWVLTHADLSRRYCHSFRCIRGFPEMEEVATSPGPAITPQRYSGPPFPERVSLPDHLSCQGTSAPGGLLQPSPPLMYSLPSPATQRRRCGTLARTGSPLCSKPCFPPSPPP